TEYPQIISDGSVFLGKSIAESQISSSDSKPHISYAEPDMRRHTQGRLKWES
ncbi:hypothetical protein Tco_1412807, partial [Tanacetum coccineum]